MRELCDTPVALTVHAEPDKRCTQEEQLARFRGEHMQSDASEGIDHLSPLPPLNFYLYVKISERIQRKPEGGNERPDRRGAAGEDKAEVEMGLPSKEGQRWGQWEKLAHFCR